MNLISYLFWTWSLVCLFLLVASYLGSWIAQEPIKINKQLIIKILLFSFIAGLLFFGLANDIWFLVIASALPLGIMTPVFIKDSWILRSDKVWTVEIKHIKKIIPYYNPRFYWMGFSLILGLIVLIKQPFDSILNWEILLIILLSYYAGILISQNKINRYNAFVQGILQNNWEWFLETEPRYSYQGAVFFRIKGLIACEYIQKNYPKFYQNAPVSFKEKLWLCKIFNEDLETFVDLINRQTNLISHFSTEERLFVLKHLLDKRFFFESFWSKLSSNEKFNEEFIWLKIKIEHSHKNWAEVENLICQLPLTEEVEELLFEIKEEKIRLIKNFNYMTSNISDYLIQEEDYQRLSPKDKLFLKKYKMDLFTVFENSCAKSGERESIEIDHFIIPKSKGGSYLMQRKDGLWVVNAIILTKKNNLIKGVKKIEEIFSIDELEKINYKLKQLSIKVNRELVGSN